jgi:hypothetical protein
MPVFPGFPRGMVRQLRVPADASAVMEWLTDSDRREREWRPRVEAREDIQESSAVRLQNGGLRFQTVQALGDSMARHIIEDVAIGKHQVDRVVRGQVARGRLRSGWMIKQRITAEWLGDATTVTVWMRGRPAGWGLVWHLLGSNDTTTARLLTREASRLADITVSAVAEHFPGSQETGAPRPSSYPGASSARRRT